MAEDTVVSAQLREERGSNASNRLRAAGWLPAVLNDTDGKSHAIRLNKHDFEVLLRHHGGESMLLDVTIEEQKPRKVLLTEVQHDPVSGDVLHADLVEVSMEKKMRVRIPVELLGECVGAVEGGVLEHLIREVEVECLPGDMVEQFEVDVSELKIGDSLMVSDLSVPAGLTVLTAPDVAVAAVAVPRVEEEVIEPEVAEEGAEPEVVGEKEEEETKEQEATEQ